MSEEERRTQADRRQTVREAVPLREYLEGVVYRAHDVALREYIEAILDEQRRGLIVAEQEREKAARALRIELERSIQDGDSALKDHIASQVEQIRAALQSSEILEVERITALRREITIINAASEEAIAKAEAANDKRFESVNEWRGQSADRERTQQEQSAALASTFMPREVAEAKIDELKRAIAELAEKLGKIV